MHPGGHIVLCIPPEAAGPVRILKNLLCPNTQTIGQYGIRVKIHVQDGFIVDAEAFDHFQAAQMFLIDQAALLVVRFDQGAQLKFVFRGGILDHGVLFRQLALPFLGGITDKNIENIADGLAVHEMAVILDPADLTVPADDAVFHIVQIILALGNLFPDAFFHGSQIFRMDHPLKRVPGQAAEFLCCLALENAQKRLIHVDDLFLVIGMVDKKAARHLVHKPDDPVWNMIAVLFQHGRQRLHGRSGFQVADRREKVRVAVRVIGNIKQGQHVFDYIGIRRIFVHGKSKPPSCGQTTDMS